MMQSDVLRAGAAIGGQRSQDAFEWSIADERGLAAIDPRQWDRLSSESLAPNPFYARGYVIAGLNTIDHGKRLRAIVFRAKGDEIAAIFPFHRIGIEPFGMARGAANLYQFSGTPLVARNHANRVIAQFTDMIAAGRLGPLFSLRNIDLDGPFAASLLHNARRSGLIVSENRRYQRPLLTRLEGGFDEHLDKVMSRSRMKDLMRNLRRLSEQGEVRFERLDSPDRIDARLDDFLRIEQSGWKGAKGTAFLSNALHAAFARRAYGAAAGLSVLDSLLLDGRPIAVSINIADGPVAFTPKCAYDETYRRFSPGLLLEYFVIKAFYEDDRWQAMDSATGITDHIIGGFWNENLTMANLVLAPGSLSGRAALATYKAVAASRSRARKLRDHVRSKMRARRSAS